MHIVNIIIYSALGCISLAALIVAGFHYRFFVRTAKRVYRKYYPSPIPTWKIAMKVKHPSLGRPRFLSVHTLAALTGRTDLSNILKEMKNSCEVGAQFCGVVKSPVFYLLELHNYNDSTAWKRAKDFIKAYPFPTTKGFQSCDGYWSGGNYGKGKYVQPDTNASPEPFIPYDQVYANEIIKALRDAGCKPGISEYKI